MKEELEKKERPLVCTEMPLKHGTIRNKSIIEMCCAVD